NDQSIGEIMAQATAKVGRDGVISIEEGKGIETEVKIVEGMQFDRGFISPHFITDQERMEAVLNDPYILIYEEKLSNMMDLIPLMEKIAAAKKPLLIIAEEIEGDALAALVVNKMKGIMECAAVKAPGYGDRRKDLLEDIAVMTGAEPVFKDLGIDLKKLPLESLGRAKKVIVASENTIIMEGTGHPEEIKKRVAKIHQEIKESDSDYDREKLQERLARFSGGVAQVNIGAATETELKEKKSRAESALHAVRAAYEEGIVPGGGVIFLRLIKFLDSLQLSGEEKAGAAIVQKALEIPLRQLVKNAGAEPSVVLRQVQKNTNVNFGYNAETEQFADLVKDGIIDAVKVLRCALQNAASVAEMLLTSEAAVTEIPEKEKSGPRMPPGGPGMGMGGMGGMPGMGGMGGM
ncbi:MAG: chaperonin GroEL, partial [Planctomycetota bacterium]